MRTELASNTLPNILVVDDFEDNCELIQTYLTNFEKVNVYTAISGLDALEIYREKDFALIILDVDMPHMDGFELAKEMKKIKNTDQSPIIYLTGNDKNSNRAATGYELGAVDYILKPYNMEFLLSKVRVFLALFHQRKNLEKEISIKSSAAEELINTNVKTKTLIEDTHECICTFCNKGKFETINPAGILLFQADNIENFIGVQFSKWVYIKDKSLFFDGFNQALNGEIVTIQLRIQTALNQIRWIQLSLTPKMELGVVKNLSGLAINITMSKNSKQRKSPFTNL